ncbi:MAG: flavoprotein [Carbonactinosporaceae bacterium]
MSASRAVYVVSSAAPPVLRLAELLALLRARGWSPCPILTPVAATWIDRGALATAAGRPVRVEPRLPGEEDPLPPADGLVAAPLSFNTLNKWASGISDTLALGVLHELMGEGVPIVAAPCVKAALRKHPSYSTSRSVLAECGVTFFDPEHTATRAPDGTLTLDWQGLVDKLATVAG